MGQQFYMEFVKSPVLVFIILVWSLIWKGLALWRAASEKQLYWFIAILLINSFGILEIIYLLKFAKTPLTIKEVKSWIPKR